jgi:hypothetical protein
VSCISTESCKDDLDLFRVLGDFELNEMFDCYLFLEYGEIFSFLEFDPTVLLGMCKLLFRLPDLPD